MQKIWQEHKIVTVPSVIVNKAGGGGSVAYAYLQQRPGERIDRALGRGRGGEHDHGARHRPQGDHAARGDVGANTSASLCAPIRRLKSGRQLMDVLKKDPQAIPFGVANSLGNANHQAIALAMKVAGIHPGESAHRGVPVGRPAR